MIVGDNTTLTNVRRHMKAAGIALGTDDDDFLKRTISEVSSMMASHAGRVFVPYKATRTFDAVGYHIGAYALDVDEDLLAINTLTNGDSTTISSGDCVLRPANVYPKYRIQIKRSAGVNFAYSDDWEEAISVDGIWGFHEDYTRAWGTTGEVVPIANLSSSATTLTLTDVDGLDSAGRVRFETGGYIKIDNEVLKVIDSAVSTNIITFLRAQLGTTAAAHSSAAVIYNYRQTPMIELLCTRLVVWVYQHRDVREGVVQLLETSITLSDSTLSDIFAKLTAYRKTTMTVID